MSSPAALVARVCLSFAAVSVRAAALFLVLLAAAGEPSVLAGFVLAARSSPAAQAAVRKTRLPNESKRGHVLGGATQTQESFPAVALA